MNSLCKALMVCSCISFSSTISSMRISFSCNADTAFSYFALQKKHRHAKREKQSKHAHRSAVAAKHKYLVTSPSLTALPSVALRTCVGTAAIPCRIPWLAFSNEPVKKKKTVVKRTMNQTQASTRENNGQEKYVNKRNSTATPTQQNKLNKRQREK